MENNKEFYNNLFKDIGQTAEFGDDSSSASSSSDSDSSYEVNNNMQVEEANIDKNNEEDDEEEWKDATIATPMVTVHLPDIEKKEEEEKKKLEEKRRKEEKEKKKKKIRRITSNEKKTALILHEVHIVTLCSRIAWRNNLCDNLWLWTIYKSLLPTSLMNIQPINTEKIKALLTWFRKEIQWNPQLMLWVGCEIDEYEIPQIQYIKCAINQLQTILLETKEGGTDHLVILFVALCRSLGIRARVCAPLTIIPLKPDIKNGPPLDMFSNKSKLHLRDKRLKRSSIPEKIPCWCEDKRYGSLILHTPFKSNAIGTKPKKMKRKRNKMTNDTNNNNDQKDKQTKQDKKKVKKEYDNNTKLDKNNNNDKNSSNINQDDNHNNSNKKQLRKRNTKIVYDLSRNSDDDFETSSSSSLKKDDDYKDNNNNNDDNDDVCDKCNQGGLLLCCDTCSRAFHLECLKPPLKHIPKNNWYCKTCQRKRKLRDTAPLKRNVKKRKSNTKLFIPTMWVEVRIGGEWICIDVTQQKGHIFSSNSPKYDDKSKYKINMPDENRILQSKVHQMSYVIAFDSISLLVPPPISNNMMIDLTSDNDNDDHDDDDDDDKKNDVNIIKDENISKQSVRKLQPLIDVTNRYCAKPSRLKKIRIDDARLEELLNSVSKNFIDNDNSQLKNINRKRNNFLKSSSSSSTTTTINKSTNKSMTLADGRIVCGNLIPITINEYANALRKEKLQLKGSVGKEDLPTTLQEYHNHPLYCIEKFCKKFEAIYPSGDEHRIGIVGSKTKYNVYKREHLHTLHTRDRWLRECRVVKSDAKPIKIVKKRKTRADQVEVGFNELFGRWQTTPWKAPIAKNGIVPKSERGNVELWTPNHLPIGTSHIMQSRASLACRKLNVDFAPAVTGFEVRGRRPVPKIEGIVICNEFVPAVLAVWQEMDDNRKRKEEEKKNERIVKGWRKVVNIIVMRHRIKEKYDNK